MTFFQSHIFASWTWLNSNVQLSFFHQTVVDSDAANHKKKRASISKSLCICNRSHSCICSRFTLCWCTNHVIVVCANEINICYMLYFNVYILRSHLSYYFMFCLIFDYSMVTIWIKCKVKKKSRFVANQKKKNDLFRFNAIIQ